MYNLFRVSLFHSDETFMCMHAQEVFFIQIRSIKKPVTFFKMVVKKLQNVNVTSQNVMKKLFETHYSLKKIVCKSQKW